MDLPIQLREHIERFLADHRLCSLYEGYRWGGDAWENGFPNMRQLEIDLSMAVKHNYLTKTHIVSVARWGRLRNVKRVQCPELMSVSLYLKDDLAGFFRLPPSSALTPLRDAIKGVGPTYLSKILMFSRPQLYGAIDTRLVRVFGKGDPNLEGLGWLSLQVRDFGYGWYIPEYQTAWPNEYDTWIRILHHIADLCNSSGHKCPHPDEYIAAGLREEGIWIAADVETALFSYASMRLEK